MIKTKAKNKTIKVAHRFSMSDELPNSVKEAYIKQSLNRRFSMEGATISTGKTAQDYCRGNTTTYIISKFITRNMNSFHSVFRKNAHTKP